MPPPLPRKLLLLIRSASGCCCPARSGRRARANRKSFPEVIAAGFFDHSQLVRVLASGWLASSRKKRPAARVREYPLTNRHTNSLTEVGPAALRWLALRWQAAAAWPSGALVWEMLRLVAGPAGCVLMRSI